MPHPYEDLDSRAFWKSAVGDRSPFRIDHVWVPKFSFQRQHRIATFGSCFAQHFSRALVARGFNWLDAEPAPAFFLPEVLRKYQYGVFSARTGNIYTAAMFRQWVRWALALEEMPSEIWEADGRFYDPFRPTIEPGGFETAAELLQSRANVLAAVRSALATADRIVFTLGLTEGWVNRERGHVYAICPGTGAGTFDPARHAFRNFTYREIESDMREAVSAIRKVNKRNKTLVTVSPVPLTATASGDHVLVATTYSKSVLRAVAGDIARSTSHVDYFPSYELICSPPFGGMFFEPNKRTIVSTGVDLVMDCFFGSMLRTFPKAMKGVARDTLAAAAEYEPKSVKDRRRHSREYDAACDEELYAAFRR